MADGRMAITLLISLIAMATLKVGGCAPAESNDTSGLNKLGSVNITIDNLVTDAWIADTDAEQTKGLMFVTADEMAPHADGRERGMIFVFKSDHSSGFWMRNTIIDLDIAFIDVDGTIVQTFTMAALDERSYRPKKMYRYALEVRAGVFERFGITEGDHVDIPNSLLKRSP